MSRSIVYAIAAAALSACASAPAYAPASGPSSAGFSQQRIEADRFFVSYRAAGAVQASLVQDYALLRAAEVTLEQGKDWFWVDRRGLDAQSARGYGGPSVGVSVGGGSWGGRGGVNVGVGVNFPIGAAESGAHSATLEIRLGEGVKPDDSNAYDARAVSANLRARLLAPRS